MSSHPTTTTIPPQELSNLSNGGPAISPRHLTLSPSSALSPLSPGTRTGLSPNSQPASPQLQVCFLHFCRFYKSLLSSISNDTEYKRCYFLGCFMMYC